MKASDGQAGPHHSSIYLALNAGQAAGAGFWVADARAAAAALLARHAQGAQLVLLLHVDAPDPGGAEESAPLPGGQRLEEEVVVHLHAVHVQVVFGDVVKRQRVGLHGRHGAVLGQLADRESGFRLRSALAGDASTDFELDGVELLLFEMIPQHVPVALPLLQGKLSEAEAFHPAVVRGHAQGAAALRGHAGEALSAAEVVDCHALKVHVAAAHPLRLLQSGWNPGREKRVRTVSYQQAEQKLLGQPEPPGRLISARCLGQNRSLVTLIRIRGWNHNKTR